MSVTMRQHVEKEIARAAITGCLARGYNISVFDSEEVTLFNSTDRKAILDAMFTTDDDRLLINYDRTTNKSEGWIYFVYGNDGWDVINDYTVNLEPALKHALKRADFWEGKE